uniref:Uncharacterized protein n=1 Tax=Ditylenchus dipsaci TaxID=166011 RepID=A0A915DUJ6_9BILA
MLSQDYECDDVLGNGNFETFRPRTQSTLSIPAHLKETPLVSRPPRATGFEDFDFRPGWMQWQEWAAILNMSLNSLTAQTK